jgi:hypothetical protein
MSIPIDRRPALAEIAGLPWGSVATVGAGCESLHRLVGPATHHGGQWCLPVLFMLSYPDAGVAEYEKEAPKLRHAYGLEPTSA